MGEFEQNLKNLKEMLSTNYNWEEHWEEDREGIEEIFRKCYVILDKNKNVKRCQCGGGIF